MHNTLRFQLQATRKKSTWKVQTSVKQAISTLYRFTPVDRSSVNGDHISGVTAKGGLLPFTPGFVFMFYQKSVGVCNKSVQNVDLCYCGTNGSKVVSFDQ